MRATKSQMEGMTMTDSILTETRQSLIDEGHRLHRAIVEWGRKHGVWAYRVLPRDGTACYFEIYDPKTKKFSWEFPAKIQKAIDDHADALAEYAKWSLSHDIPPPVRVLTRGIPEAVLKGRGAHGRDCNAEMRSMSPIKSDTDIDPSGDSSQKNSASDGRANRSEVDLRR